MMRTSGDQGKLFGPATSTRAARRRQPPKQITVIISTEAITAMTRGRIDAERVSAEAVRAARPDVRNVAVDLGTIRWTDPKTNRCVTVATPVAVRDALLALARGDATKVLVQAARCFSTGSAGIPAAADSSGSSCSSRSPSGVSARRRRIRARASGME